MTTLIGREHEVRRLRRVLAQDGPRALVVCGAAGVGKSRLLIEIADAAGAAGWAVERIFGSPAVRTIPLGAIARLLPEHAARDPAPLFHAAVAEVRRRAREQPVLLAVDDGHELDEGSTAFIRQLVMHGDAKAVVTVRVGASMPSAIASLWAGEDGARLDLSPLRRRDTEHLVNEVLGAPAAGKLLQAAWRLTRGHPLFLLVALGAARDEGTVTFEGGIWRLNGQLTSIALGDLVLSRIHGLDASLRHGLEVLALAGPIPRRHLASVVVDAVLDVLDERGLLSATTEDQVTVAHPLYGEVITEVIGSERGRAVRAEVADAILADPDASSLDRFRAAAWMLEAGRSLEHDLALEASHEATRRFDYRLAEQLARAALVPDPDSTEAAIALGRALGFQGRGEEAEEVLVEAGRGSEEDRANAALVRGHITAFVLGRPAEAAELLGQVAAGLGDASRWRLDAERALYGAIGGDFAATFEAASRAFENPDTPDQTRLTALINLTLARSMTAQLDEFEEAVETGLRLAERHADEQPLAADQLLLNRVSAWASAGRLTDAVRLSGARAEAAEDAGTPNPLILAWHGAGLGLCGRLDEAIEAQEQAITLFDRADPFRLRAQSVGMLVIHQAQAARLPADVGATIDAAADEAGSETRLAVWVGRARAWMAAAADDVDAAAEMATAVGRSAIEHDHVAWGVLALHDAVRLGRPALVRDDIVRAVEASRGAVLLEIMRDHAVGLARNDTRALEEVALRYVLAGSPLFAAEAAGQLARVLHQAGAAEAAARAAACSALWHRDCPSATTPALRDLPEGLTARELDIAAAAATGAATSKELADRFYLSVRTVDNHLHAIYRKLGVEGREELAGVFAGVLAGVPAGASPSGSGRARGRGGS